MCHAPGAAAELEDLRAFGNGRVDDLGLAPRRQHEVEIHRGTVRGDAHVSVAASFVALRWAIASIVTIGFTPLALGNDEPSMT